MRSDAATRSTAAYTLYLTPAGRDLLADLERLADERDVELLSALDASERSQLISLLQRVAESQGLAAGVHPDLEPREGDDRGGERRRQDPPRADSATVPLEVRHRTRQLPRED